jgi:PAS domain S-box-containing protein
VLLWLLSSTFSALTAVICLVLVRYRAGRRWLLFFAVSSAFFAMTALLAAYVPSVDASQIRMQGTMPAILTTTTGFIVFAVYAVLSLENAKLSLRQAALVTIAVAAVLNAVDVAFGSRLAFGCILVGNVASGAYIAVRLMRRGSVFYIFAGAVFAVRAANGLLTLVVGLGHPEPLLVEIIRHVSVGANLATALSVLLIEFDDTRRSLIETRDTLATTLERTEALSQSRAEINRQLASVLDSTLVGIYAVREGRVVSVNRRAEELLDAAQGDLVGKPIGAYFSAPDAYREFEARAALPTEDRVPLAGEFEMLRSDSRPRWILLSGRTMAADGAASAESVWMMVDISDRKQAELALRQSERKFQSLFRDSPIAMSVRDSRERRIIQVNPAWERLTGWTAMEAFGKTSAELDLYISDADRERVVAARNRHGVDDVQVDIKTKSGERKTVQLHGNPLAGYDPDLHIVMSVDITEQVRLESQLRQAQKLEAIGQLTGGIAHDFNNLLAVILGNLEALQKHLSGSERVRLDKAILAAERGASLTRNLLSFARRQPLTLTAVSIQAVLGDMLTLLRTFVDERISIDLRVDGDPPTVQIDSGMLQNAVINLVVNARDALAHGGHIGLGVACREIDVGTIRGKRKIPPGRYVELTISDDGTGIDEKVIDRIFEPFFTTKELGSGTGLGLSMVHGFAEQSGGHLWVESSVGTGTTVHLLFPETAVALPALSRPAASELLDGAGRHVLVVEDNAGVAALVGEILDGFGFAAILIRTAPEAVDTLRGNGPIDILVTDIVLPGAMNGCQLVEAARALRPGLACILMSGYPRDALESMDLLDSVPLLRKPFRAADMAHALRQVLEAPDATS